MDAIEAALRAAGELEQSGIVTSYAIAGAMALVFWIEPVATYDLDVLVLLPESESPIVSLEPIYRWAAERGYQTSREHVLIEGIPVQFLPAHNDLADEAIHSAVSKHFGELIVRVVRPEYLIALYLEPSARTLKRRERAAALRESATIDAALLRNVMDRFKLVF